MERYSSYKPTAIQWLKEIPGHWEERRLKTLVTCNDEALSDKFDKETEIQYVEIGDVDQVNGIKNSTFYKFKDAPSRARRITRVGDIIISTVRTYLKAIAFIDKHDLIVSTGFAVLRPHNVLPRYLAYATMCDGFTTDVLRYSIGISYPAISSNDLLGLKITLPSYEEQEKIVSYLENKTSKIDAYVTDKEKEIQLLQELKQKTIAEAVTKGLNPNVKMKDSSISWLGMIPEHWEMRKLSQVSYEHFISNKTIHHQNLLSLSYGRIIRKDINKTEGLLPASFDTYQIVEDGNIVLRLTDLQNDQKSLRVGLAKEEGIVTSAYVCLGVYNSMIPAYLYNVLHSYDIKKLFYSMGGGIRQGLNWQGLKKIDVPLPPLDEQRAIVSYIEEKCQKIDTLIMELQAEIDYLKEYKQRLIADVVTGQINVQNEMI